MPKSFDELTFSDDWMFQKVMRNPAICAELVARLLHINVDHVEYPELEKTIAPYYQSKGVRLDVYLKDSNKVIDIECQSNLKPALGKRTRYYQSMIDIDSLMKGEEYEKLKESYILFICKNDPFKDEQENHFGLPCYTFRNVCSENGAVNLDDKTIKVIYNASAYEREEDSLIKDFLHYIYTDKPGEDDLSNRLSRLVKKYKEDENLRSDYLAVNLHDHDIRYEALQEGEQIGAQKKALETATNMIRKKYPISDISEITGLPPEKVLELQEQITQNRKH